MEKDEPEVKRHELYLAVILQGVSLLFLLALLIIFAKRNGSTLKSVLHLGPGTKDNPIEIMGLNINTNYKFMLLLFWLVFSEILATYSHKIFKNWYRNYLLSPRCDDVGISDTQALVLVNVFNVLSFIPRIFKLLLTVITVQAQFLVISFITRRVVSSFIDRATLHNKHKRRQQKKKEKEKKR